jgi:hypothetical protein
MDEGGDKHSGYRWEGGYERTWEALREDDTGALISGSSAAKRLFAKKRLAQEAGQRIHIVRYRQRRRSLRNNHLGIVFWRWTCHVLWPIQIFVLIAIRIELDAPFAV